MYGEESRGVPLYINNYGKADHGGGQPQVSAKNSHIPNILAFPVLSRDQKTGFHMSLPLGGWEGRTQDW